MKKIIFVIDNLMVGGIQKSLINLLNELNGVYVIDLVVFSHVGGYMTKIPKGINIIKENKRLRYLGVSQKESIKYGVFFYIIRFFLSILNKFFGAQLIRRKILSNCKLEGKYHAAISFTHNFGYKTLASGCNEYVLDNIDSEIKISYIHGDYDKLHCNNIYDNKIYSEFDKIACVSDSSRQIFLKSNPALEQKTYVSKNLTNYEEIKILSQETDISVDNKYFNVISVSRLSHEKAILRTLKIIKILVERRYKIRLYIIGDGPLKSQIKKTITKYGISKNVILLGMKLNPYTFMKKMDLLLLASFHEAAPMVFNESKVLSLPILTTNTSSALEMVSRNYIGWVCENNEDAILNSLENIMKYELHNKIIFDDTFDNTNELKQFKDLIGD